MATAKCKKFDLSGKALEEVEISYGEEPNVHSQSIKDYIIALRENARQWSANTRGKGESHHSNKKPHPQKGTGRARQGSLASPQYKGGGRAFTPKPKFNQHVRINKKERRAVIRSLLIEKLKSGDLSILHFEGDKYFSEPKTKVSASFFNTIGWEGNRILCFGLSGADMENFKLSLRNIPKASYLMLENANGYDLMANKKILVLETAMHQLDALLKEGR